ncbi:hypothetical protein IAT38_000737 [Cryptococcus sp. DSM 104549]
MLSKTLLVCAAALTGIPSAFASSNDVYDAQNLGKAVIGGIPYETREHWMQIAHDAIAEIGPSPCPLSPFGTVIVEHKADGTDAEWCRGINTVSYSGNPNMHGEISAFRNCTQIMRKRGMSADEINSKWRVLSLYTNGEPCPQCASACRYAGIKEVIYGSSIADIYKSGRPQLLVSPNYINEKSVSFGHSTVIIPAVLKDVTDTYFAYQFNESAPCPHGCERHDVPGTRTTRCEATEEWLNGHESIWL